MMRLAGQRGELLLQAAALLLVACSCGDDRRPASIESVFTATFSVPPGPVAVIGHAREPQVLVSAREGGGAIAVNLGDGTTVAESSGLGRSLLGACPVTTGGLERYVVTVFAESADVGSLSVDVFDRESNTFSNLILLSGRDGWGFPAQPCWHPVGSDGIALALPRFEAGVDDEGYLVLLTPEWIADRAAATEICRTRDCLPVFVARSGVPLAPLPGQSIQRLGRGYRVMRPTPAAEGASGFVLGVWECDEHLACDFAPRDLSLPRAEYTFATSGEIFVWMAWTGEFAVVRSDATGVTTVSTGAVSDDPSARILVGASTATDGSFAANALVGRPGEPVRLRSYAFAPSSSIVATYSFSGVDEAARSDVSDGPTVDYLVARLENRIALFALPY